MTVHGLVLLGVGMAAILGTAADSRAGQIPIADVLLPGTKIRLNDASGPVGRRTYIALRDGDDAIALPDPRVTGATVYIGRVGAGDVTALDLPAAGWGGGGRDFKFKSRSGVVASARIVEGRSVRVSARGEGAYPLGGTPQGGVGVIVEVGGVRFCGLFGGTITKDDGESFRARRAPAPAGCPLLGSTTTTTSTSTTSTTTLIGMMIQAACHCLWSEPGGEICDRSTTPTEGCAVACPVAECIARCNQRPATCSAGAEPNREFACDEGDPCIISAP